MSNFNSELVETNIETIAQSTIFNEDLAPVSITKRTWGIYNIAALWIGMSVCIPTYMLASGLISGGINWWQALMTISLGNFIVLVPMVLNAHAGTKYGIPFPIIALLASLVATLTTNIAANVVSPSNDFSNMFPKKINFIKGGMMTAVLGIVIMPWKLLFIVLIFLAG